MSYIQIDNKKGSGKTYACKTGIKYGLYDRVNTKNKSNPLKSIFFCISLDLCNEIGLNVGDKINLFVDENDNLKWLLKKSDDDNGHKIYLRTKNWMCFSISIYKFKNIDYIMSQFDKKFTKSANYIINPDKSININGSSQEDESNVGINNDYPGLVTGS